MTHIHKETGEKYTIRMLETGYCRTSGMQYNAFWIVGKIISVLATRDRLNKLERLENA